MCPMSEEEKEAKRAAFCRLRGRISSLEGQLRVVQAELNQFVSQCTHQWMGFKYDPIVTKGYQDPGDPPGTMGSDWRPATYVPGTEKPRWTRECWICGHKEFTEEYETQETRHPQWR